MDNEKLTITIISIVTIAIFVFILFTSTTKTQVNPTPSSYDKTSIIGDEPHVKGLPLNESQVILVEFSDFECPACASYAPVLSSLVDKYPMSLVYRHFPLPQHTKARLAAQASEAANLQGKFWEYSDLLFEKSPELSEEQLIGYAQELELNVDQFKSDLKSDSTVQKVIQDFDFSNEIGLNATPSFFIVKGDKVEKFNPSGNASLEDWLKQFIEPVQ